jgi:hypothetical protein
LISLGGEIDFFGEWNFGMEISKFSLEYMAFVAFVAAALALLAALWQWQ